MIKEESGWGDQVKESLEAVGITGEHLSAWLGVPCGCEERRQKLNQLHNWTRRILAGKVEKAREYFNRMAQ